MALSSTIYLKQYEYLDSLTPMRKQVQGLSAELIKISEENPNGFHMIASFLDQLTFGVDKETAWLPMYTKLGQLVSVANYWNDPKHQSLYKKKCEYLPVINNEIQSNNSAFYKSNIEDLCKMVLVGGPDDEVISPWQSSQFAYYKDNSEVVLEMMNRDIYTANRIGLKTLNDTDRLVIVTVPGVKHLDWKSNPSVFNNHVIPHLD